MADLPPAVAPASLSLPVAPASLSLPVAPASLSLPVAPASLPACSFSVAPASLPACSLFSRLPARCRRYDSIRHRVLLDVVIHLRIRRTPMIVVTPDVQEAL